MNRKRISRLIILSLALVGLAIASIGSTGGSYEVNEGNHLFSSTGIGSANVSSTLNYSNLSVLGIIGSGNISSGTLASGGGLWSLKTDIARPNKAGVSLQDDSGDLVLSWLKVIDNFAFASYTQASRMVETSSSDMKYTVYMSPDLAFSADEIVSLLGASPSINLGLASSFTNTMNFLVQTVDQDGNYSDSTIISYKSGIIIDTATPNRILALKATISGSDYLLNWQVVSDNVKTSYYSVYRSSSPSLNNAVKLLDTGDLSHTDSGIVGTGTYYYFVKAVDAANNESTTSNVAYLSAMTLPIIQDGGDTFVWFSLPANTSYRTARDLALALSPTGLKFTSIMDNDYLTQENRPYLYNTIAGWSSSPLDNFNLDPSKGYWLGLNKNVSSVSLNIIGSHSTTRSIEVTSNVGNTSLIMINLPYNHAYNNSIELLNDINTQMGLTGDDRIAGLAEYSVSERLYKWTNLNSISGYQKEDQNTYLNVTGAAIMLNVLKANGNVLALKWIPRVKSY